MSTFSVSRQDMLEAFIRFRKASGSWNEDYESRPRLPDRSTARACPILSVNGNL